MLWFSLRILIFLWSFVFADKCFASFSATLHVFCKCFTPIRGVFLLPVSILCIFLVIFHQFPLLRSFLCLFGYFVSLFYYLVAAFSSFCTNFRLFLLLVLHISLLSNIALVFNNFTCFQSFYTHQCSNCLNVAHFCDFCVSLCSNLAFLLVLCLF